MAVLRHEISLSVLKYFEHAKRFHISKQKCNVSFIIINTNEIPKHFTSILFLLQKVQFIM